MSSIYAYGLCTKKERHCVDYSSSSPEVEEEAEVYCNPLTEVVQEVPSYLDFRQQTGYKPDRDLEDKVRKACERFSENVHICANEVN